MWHAAGSGSSALIVAPLAPPPTLIRLQREVGGGPAACGGLPGLIEHCYDAHAAALAAQQDIWVRPAGQQGHRVDDVALQSPSVSA